MIGAICAHIHNYFTDEADIHAGTWTIADGDIDLSAFLLNGQYFRIVGSALNDGVYRYPVTPEPDKPATLADETFAGEIWAMKVPRDVLALSAEITEWQAQYGKASMSPYQSESYGGYSYSLKNGTNGTGSARAASSWQGVFATRLNEWRKLR